LVFLKIRILQLHFVEKKSKNSNYLFINSINLFIKRINSKSNYNKIYHSAK